MENEMLKTIIVSLIASHREGGYWDFKEYHHTNKANLLHDIICMANNMANHDGYLIFGVKNENFSISGVENDPKRKDLNAYINFLKGKKFAGGNRPDIDFYTFKIENHEVDVLVIKESQNVPYYLSEKFQDSDRFVKADAIYTRVGDTNTDITGAADPNHIEDLWAKRLGKTKKSPDFEIHLCNDYGNARDDFHYRFIAPTGLAHSTRLLDEDEIIDGVTINDIEQYNASLPSKAEIGQYNIQKTLYENAQNNCHTFVLEVLNSGKAKAQSLHIDLSFQQGLLVYRDNAIEDMREPKPLEIPKNPIVEARRKAERDMERERRKNLPFGNMLNTLEQIGEGIPVCNFDIPSLNTSSLLGVYSSKDYYVGENHSELSIKINELLHTRVYKSDRFSVIATKQGVFKIGYTIMCEEFEQPVSGEFEITVK